MMIMTTIMRDIIISCFPLLRNRFSFESSRLEQVCFYDENEIYGEMNLFLGVSSYLHKF